MNTSTLNTPTSALRQLVVDEGRDFGSHKVKHPLLWGCDVVTYDRLSTGNLDAAPGCEFRLRGLATQDALFSCQPIDADSKGEVFGRRDGDLTWLIANSTLNMEPGLQPQLYDPKAIIGDTWQGEPSRRHVDLHAIP